MRALGLFLGVCAGASLASTAIAVTFTGDTSAIFGTPTPSVSVIGAGTGNLSFGSATKPNVLQFTGQTFSTTDSGTPFSLGTLSYLNGITDDGATSVPVTVNLTFTSPAGVVTTMPLSFSLNATPNIPGNVVGSSDTLSLTGAQQNLTVGNQAFALTLSGFSQDNGSTFSQLLTNVEGQTITPILFAQITPVGGGGAGPSIPELSTSSLLLLAAGSLLARFRRS